MKSRDLLTLSPAELDALEAEIAAERPRRQRPATPSAPAPQAEESFELPAVSVDPYGAERTRMGR